MQVHVVVGDPAVDQPDADVFSLFDLEVALFPHSGGIGLAVDGKKGGPDLRRLGVPRV